ncbi:40S ribosomal protein S3a [Portunus trituberculatus]|uniref:40S ribosomal protein S3a n=1 Tax=Portunus trituberculatus TaxID=210409 RepID=A0A5B7F786_PORTR|nr:40S ribosomal protein S3a [Portunus trituberculatus]
MHGESGKSTTATGEDVGSKVDRPDNYEPPVQTKSKSVSVVVDASDSLTMASLISSLLALTTSHTLAAASWPSGDN